jgi:hypothetical protein
MWLIVACNVRCKGKGPGPGLGVLVLEPVVKVWVGIRLGGQGRGRGRGVCSDLFISLLIIYMYDIYMSHTDTALRDICAF